MYVVHGVFVVANVANGVDKSRQRAALCQICANPEIIDDGRVNYHYAGPLVDLIGENRREIHAHWRFTGFVPSVIWVHRCNPI